MSVKQVLARWTKSPSGPGRWLGDAYLCLRPARIREMLRGTGAVEHTWETRHLHKGNDWANAAHAGKPNEWVLSYWDSRDHPHRRFLAERLTALYPFRSVLEIGANCAPNLYLLARRFPGAAFNGVDINPEAVARGREMLAAAGVSNVTLAVARADDLAAFPDKSFDVVFTDAVLIYIGPDKIDAVMREIRRVARRHLVFLEMQPKPGAKRAAVSGVRRFGLWARDYAVLLRRYFPGAAVRVTPLPPDVWPDPAWQQAGILVEADLTGDGHAAGQETRP